MREIKIVANPKTGKVSVRNIPDVLTRDEIVVAARWQDAGGVKAFAWTSAQADLSRELGYEPELNSSKKEFEEFLKANW